MTAIAQFTHPSDKFVCNTYRMAVPSAPQTVLQATFQVKETKLVAHWVVENGVLVCRWKSAT